MGSKVFITKVCGLLFAKFLRTIEKTLCFASFLLERGNRIASQMFNEDFDVLKGRTLSNSNELCKKIIPILRLRFWFLICFWFLLFRFATVFPSSNLFPFSFAQNSLALLKMIFISRRMQNFKDALNQQCFATIFCGN